MRFRLICACLSFCLSVQAAMPQARVKTLLLSEKRHDDFQRGDLFAFDAEPEEKSVWLAVASSLVLPGMGELYVGSFSTGQYFLMADAGLWLTYAGFVSHGNWLREDARSFANQHANVTLEGKDEQFEVNIGNFSNVEEYNQQKLRNREYDLMYTVPDYAWQWDNDSQREQFKLLRIRSDETFRNANFLIAAAVMNRIVSAFMAGRAASAHNKRVFNEEAWRIGIIPLGGPLSTHGIVVKVSKEF